MSPILYQHETKCTEYKDVSSSRLEPITTKTSGQSRAIEKSHDTGFRADFGATSDFKKKQMDQSLLKVARIASNQPPVPSSISKNRQDEVTQSAFKKPAPNCITKISVLEYFPKHMRAWKTDIAEMYASSYRKKEESSKNSIETSTDVLSHKMKQKDKKRKFDAVESAPGDYVREKRAKCEEEKANRKEGDQINVDERVESAAKGMVHKGKKRAYDTVDSLSSDGTVSKRAKVEEEKEKLCSKILDTPGAPLSKVPSELASRSAGTNLSRCSQLENESTAKEQQNETLSNNHIQSFDSECGKHSTSISKVEASKSATLCGVAHESQPSTASQHSKTEQQLIAKSSNVTDRPMSGMKEAVAAPISGLKTNNSMVPVNPIRKKCTTTGTTFVNPNNIESNPKLTRRLEPANPKGKRKSSDLEESHNSSSKRQRGLDSGPEDLTKHIPTATKYPYNEQTSRPTAGTKRRDLPNIVPPTWLYKGKDKDEGGKGKCPCGVCFRSLKLKKPYDKAYENASLAIMLAEIESRRDRGITERVLAAKKVLHSERT